MAGFSTIRAADTLADTLVIAIRQGWMDHRHIRTLAWQFMVTSPLEHSGRVLFWRSFEKRLAFYGQLKLSAATYDEVRAGKRRGPQ